MRYYLHIEPPTDKELYSVRLQELQWLINSEHVKQHGIRL